MGNDYRFNIDQRPDKPSKATQSRSAIGNVIFLVPRKAKIVLSIIVIALFFIGLLIVLKPQAQKRAIPEIVVSVDVEKVTRSSYPIVVNTNGTIEAETRGNLVAQIRGEIMTVSNNFKTGGTFKKGDQLLQIDQRDYQADLSRAAASLSQAEVAYRQEQANSKQAKLDWERLGNTSPAPNLVLRKPQLAAAKAQLDSAVAAHRTAQLNLSRTTVTAPYHGRVIQRQAVLGQYVSVGTPVAEVFAIDGVEVRLPISQKEFSQLGLDQFLGAQNTNMPFNVVLNSTVGAQKYHWDAEITRTDSTFDINTRQIDVIAEVKDPFGKKSGQPTLKIGQFVTARIQGRTIDNVFVIPNKSIREGSYIYVVRDETLAKQSIEILWQDDEKALISKGLGDGELVVTTSLNSTLAGARAKLSESSVKMSTTKAGNNTQTNITEEVTTPSPVPSSSGNTVQSATTEPNSKTAHQTANQTTVK